MASDESWLVKTTSTEKGSRLQASASSISSLTGTLLATSRFLAKYISVSRIPSSNIIIWESEMGWAEVIYDGRNE